MDGIIFHSGMVLEHFSGGRLYGHRSLKHGLAWDLHVLCFFGQRILSLSYTYIWTYDHEARLLINAPAALVELALTLTHLLFITL